MKLNDLILTFNHNMTFAIEYNDDIFKYQDPQELYDDYMFFDEVKDKNIVEIWNAPCLYNSIVIVVEG